MQRPAANGTSERSDGTAPAKHLNFRPAMEGRAQRSVGSTSWFSGRAGRGPKQAPGGRRDPAGPSGNSPPSLLRGGAARGCTACAGHAHTRGPVWGSRLTLVPAPEVGLREVLVGLWLRQPLAEASAEFVPALPHSFSPRALFVQGMELSARSAGSGRGGGTAVRCPCLLLIVMNMSQINNFSFLQLDKGGAGRGRPQHGARQSARCARAPALLRADVGLMLAQI